MVSVSMMIHFNAVLVLVCFCTIMTMDNWAYKFNLQNIRQSLLYYLYAIFFFTGAIGVVYSSLRNSQSQQVSHPQQDQRTFLLSFTGMGIFFIGILIKDSLYLANLAYCFEVLMYCDKVKIAGFIMYHFFRPVYFGMQLMFMVWIRYNRLSRGYSLNTTIGHSINITMNLALIIYCADFQTQYYVHHNPNHSGRDTHLDFFACNPYYGEPAMLYPQKIAMCLATNTTLMNLNRKLRQYVLPMQVQLAWLAISVMISQVTMSWAATTPADDGLQLQRHSDYDVNDDSDSEQEEEVGPRLWSALRARLPQPFWSRDQAEEQPLIGRQRSGVFNPILIVGMFICCIQIIASVVGQQDLPNTLWFVLIVKFTWHLSLLISSACILKYMWKNNQGILYTPMPSSAFVILGSSACAHNLYFYKLIANADILARPVVEWDRIKNATGLSDTGLKWYVINDAVNYCIRIVGVVIQSLIIIRVCRELSTAGYCLNLTSRVRTSFYYLMVVNIVSWFWDSITGINDPDIIKETYYSTEVWRALLRAFMPGFMYFEFHSGMILAEYMIAQWYNNHRWQELGGGSTLTDEQDSFASIPGHDDGDNSDGTLHNRIKPFSTM